MTDSQMHLLHVHSTAIGYARYGVKLVAALTDMGVKVDDELGPTSTDVKHLTCWISTPSHAAGWFDGQYPVISTMWESMTMPETFREGMHNFAQIIVPSEQNLELFSRYHPNVKKVPLGIDSVEWRYRERQVPVNTFRFLIGGSGTRKGPDLAYKAFRKVFKTWPSDMPVPVLQFKSPRPVDFVGERIEHIGGRISDEAERDLYAAAHCYLQPSRGEGFGLQPLQAIAQGLPTILTDAHGHTDFAHLGYAISAQHSKADFFVFGEAGDWWEPSLDELCERMEYVYYNYDEACRHAEEMSPLAHEWFSWERCAENFMDAIGREHFTAPYTGTHHWFKPDYKRYLIRVVKPWAAEISGSHYQFKAERKSWRLEDLVALGNAEITEELLASIPVIKTQPEYWEVADIKRMLWEADVLDPSCVVINPEFETTFAETGLTEQQLEELPEYSAAHSYCWQCGQPLNSKDLYQVPDPMLAPEKFRS